jgi:hypothetical protein
VTVAAADQFTNNGAVQFPFTVVAPQPPTVSHQSLSGVAKRNVKLSFTFSAGQYAPALQSVVVSLPSGMSFSKARKLLAKDIVVRGANGRKMKFRAGVSHGRLTVRFSSAVTKASITITSPEISVSSSLATKAHKRRPPKVSFGLKLIDAASAATVVNVKLKL